MIHNSKVSNASLFTAEPSVNGNISLILSEKLRSGFNGRGCEIAKLPEVPFSPSQMKKNESHIKLK